MSRPVLIRGARVVDPAREVDGVGDVYLSGGRVAPLPAVLPPEAEVVDARGLVACPGLWDLHVHLREPGGEPAETVWSGSRAAARGGFTTIVAMPNTVPPIDTPALVRQVLERGEAAGFARVWTTACITRERRGEAVLNYGELAEAGAAAFTDDGSTVQDDGVMERAMAAIRALGMSMMDHAQDRVLEAQGVVHDGGFARRWGLPGIPARAEARIVERDIRLAAATGCRVHVQHLSSREGVDLLRTACARGAPVSWEATPHHLALCDADVRPEDARFKMNPPLRSADDRAALVAAVLEDRDAVLATDHAPHSKQAKDRGMLEAPFGITGLETAVGLTHEVLVRKGGLAVPEWVRRWTVNPARALGLAPPSLAEGQRADLVLLDLGREWTYDTEETFSRSTNSPFHGWTLSARAICTFLEGRSVWLDTRVSTRLGNAVDKRMPA